MKAIVICVALILISSLDAIGETFLVFDGFCKGETGVKSGFADDPAFPALKARKIICDTVTFIALPNGRKLLMFINSRDSQATGDGFAGLDMRRGKQGIFLTIDRMYPSRPAGTDLRAQNEAAAKTKIDAEGFCAFTGTAIERATNINCATKIEKGDRKSVYRINFTVTGASWKDLNEKTK